MRRKIFLLIFWTLFSKSLSAQIAENPEDISPLLVGETLPDVPLVSMDNQQVQTSALWKGQKTIVIVYRGGWCPYCNTHLNEVGRIEKELLALGYGIIAISTDGPEKLMKSVEKNNLTYQLYSDSEGRFAKAAGLAFKAPSRHDKTLTESSGGKNTDLFLPVPALFIVNEKGEILFEHINPNYKVRIRGDLLLAVANSLSKNKP